MAIENIELLRDEAQRLLRLNIEGLEQMMEVDGLITKAEETGKNSKQTFDRTSMPKSIEVLRNELAKLEKMELVIAVVGTVKAGKSTTINAIVGKQVLPNRDDPMTALPTLIRHTPSQVEPILKFENNKPINDLLEGVGKRIDSGEIPKEQLQALSNDSDMEELIADIVNKQSFDAHHEGTDKIFKCLKKLNDLVRLFTKLDIYFPFSSYSNIEEIPVIEVTFAHVVDTKNTQGRFSLLDTPGPNEANQEELRPMMQGQLEKASSVLLVLENSQFGSEATVQVQEDVQNFAGEHPERIFAVVNKFDTRGEHADDIQQIKKKRVESLKKIGISINSENIFLVSARNADLANRAKDELTANQKLPDPNTTKWVKIFAKEAELGRNWVAKKSTDDIIEDADSLWEESGFPSLLDSFVRPTHAKTALLSIDSAAGKLAKCANDVENFLGARRGAFSESIAGLQKIIDDFKIEIDDIEKADSDTQTDVNLFFNDLETEAKKAISAAQKKIDAEIKFYFLKGKENEKRDTQKKEKEAKSEKDAWKNRRGAKIGNVIGSAIKMIDAGSVGNKNEKNLDFNPNQKIIRLEEGIEVQELLNKIRQATEFIVKDQHEVLSRHINKKLSGFYKKFNTSKNNTEEQIKKINFNILNDGFKVILKPPNTEKIDNIYKNIDISINKNFEYDKRKEYYSVKKNDWWAKVQNWLNDDWGREQRTKELNGFIINLDKTQGSIKDKTNEVFENYSSIVKKEVIEPLLSEISAYFSEVKTTVEGTRGNLQQGISDKQNDRIEIDKLVECLDRLIAEKEDISNDIKELEEDIKALKADAQSHETDKLAA